MIFEAVKVILSMHRMKVLVLSYNNQRFDGRFLIELMNKR
jgi:hypothetical protein